MVGFRVRVRVRVRVRARARVRVRVTVNGVCPALEQTPKFTLQVIS